MISFVKRFFSDEAFFERAARGALFGGSLLVSQAQVMPGGLNWRNVAAAAMATLGGMVAAGDRNPPK